MLVNCRDSEENHMRLYLSRQVLKCHDVIHLSHYQPTWLTLSQSYQELLRVFQVCHSDPDCHAGGPRICG